MRVGTVQLPARVGALVVRMLEPDWRKRCTLHEALGGAADLISPFPNELRRTYTLLSSFTTAGSGQLHRVWDGLTSRAYSLVAPFCVCPRHTLEKRSCAERIRWAQQALPEICALSDEVGPGLARRGAAQPAGMCWLTRARARTRAWWRGAHVAVL